MAMIMMPLVGYSRFVNPSARQNVVTTLCRVMPTRSLSGATSNLAFKTPSSGGSGLVVSTASTPSLQSGVSVSGGTSLFGDLANWGGTATGGSSVSLSSYSGGSSMGGMGGRPGGW